jgi:hypothetical protein
LLIDDHLAVLAQAHAGVFQAETVGTRRPAGGHDDDVASGLSAVGQFDEAGGTVAPGSGGASAGADLDACTGEGLWAGSPTRGSSRVRSRSLRWMRVTETPKRARSCATPSPNSTAHHSFSVR